MGEDNLLELAIKKFSELDIDSDEMTTFETFLEGVKIGYKEALHDITKQVESAVRGR